MRGVLVVYATASDAPEVIGAIAEDQVVSWVTCGDHHGTQGILSGGGGCWMSARCGLHL